MRVWRANGWLICNGIATCDARIMFGQIHGRATSQPCYVWILIRACVVPELLDQGDVHAVRCHSGAEFGHRDEA